MTRLLLGPGPSNPYPEVMEALRRPVLGHLDPEFLGVFDETCERLRHVFRTANRLTLPVSGTGSAGMEACLVNLLEPGDTAIVGINGVFGERLAEIATRCGATVIRVEAPWGRPLDPDDLLAAQRATPQARVLATVHAETSTGVENPIAPLAALTGTGTLLVVDAVTSLGGIPLEVDGWGIDACYSGTQKCLGVPPGLAPVTFSLRAAERLATRATPPQSWYLDLGLVGAYQSERRYHHTLPISMIYALHAGLGVLLEEGLEASWARHRVAGDRLHAALPEIGFELLVDPAYRLPQLTTAFVPPGLDDATARRTLLDEHSIEVGGGLGEFAGKLWRIGLMGHNARPEVVDRLIAAQRKTDSR
jgi:alanine-glyoxylate transaminase/serine-glyoxylate transaminase/serine-pyruvate transaminase